MGRNRKQGGERWDEGSWLRGLGVGERMRRGKLRAKIGTIWEGKEDAG